MLRHLPASGCLSTGNSLAAAAAASLTWPPNLPVLGIVRVVKKVELAVAKMKNTGSNIKHVFTSRCAKKRERQQFTSP